MKKYTDKQLLAAGNLASKIGVRTAARQCCVDQTVLYVFMKARSIPRLPVGNQVVWSPAQKRRALRLARRYGVHEAANRTGLGAGYIRDLLGARCRVWGFEGTWYKAQLREVGLEPRVAKAPSVAWAKNRAA